MSSINDEKYFDRKIVQYYKIDYNIETVIFEDENVMLVEYQMLKEFTEYITDHIIYLKGINEIFTFHLSDEFIKNVNEEYMYQFLYIHLCKLENNPFYNHYNHILAKYKSIKRKKLIDSL